jgi:hypothetical protein
MKNNVTDEEQSKIYVQSPVEPEKRWSHWLHLLPLVIVIVPLFSEINFEKSEHDARCCNFDDNKRNLFRTYLMNSVRDNIIFTFHQATVWWLIADHFPGRTVKSKYLMTHHHWRSIPHVYSSATRSHES